MSKLLKQIADETIKDKSYFDEQYNTNNKRWTISIKKEKDFLTVCFMNNSENSIKYPSQPVFKITSYMIDGNIHQIPKYLKKELEKIQERYYNK